MELNGRPTLIFGLVTYLLCDLGNLLSLCLIFLISRMGLIWHYKVFVRINEITSIQMFTFTKLYAK